MNEEGVVSSSIMNRWIDADLKALVFKAFLTGDGKQVDRLLWCFTMAERQKLLDELDGLANKIMNL